MEFGICNVKSKKLFFSFTEEMKSILSQDKSIQLNKGVLYKSKGEQNTMKFMIMLYIATHKNYYNDNKKSFKVNCKELLTFAGLYPEIINFSSNMKIKRDIIDKFLDAIKDINGMSDIDIKINIDDYIKQTDENYRDIEALYASKFVIEKIHKKE